MLSCVRVSACMRSLACTHTHADVCASAHLYLHESSMRVHVLKCAGLQIRFTVGVWVSWGARACILTGLHARVHALVRACVLACVHGWEGGCEHECARAHVHAC